MQYEVEQKFPVADISAVQSQLEGLGASFGETVVQLDRYFAHPARDFASTDEALRIRTVGTRCRVTYKGPKVDTTTKTRQEIELPLGDGPDVATRWTGLLKVLGFTPVLEVCKHRRCGQLTWNDATVEIALDDVDRIGTFVELELTADTSQVDEAKQQISSLADRLGLSGAERRSYLELLLAATGG
jgi:adenylate cyclase class 2